MDQYGIIERVVNIKYEAPKIIINTISVWKDKHTKHILS